MGEKEFRELVDNYSLLILKVISTVLNDEKDKMFIDDCYNEVLLCIWQKYSSFRNDSKIKNWIVTIAKNKSIDFKRKVIRNDRVIDKIIFEFTSNNEKSPDDIYMEKINNEELYGYINMLSIKEKLLFQQRYILDLEVEEICKRNMIAANVLYTRLNRIRKKLRDIIIEERRQSYE